MTDAADKTSRVNCMEKLEEGALNQILPVALIGTHTIRY